MFFQYKGFATTYTVFMFQFKGIDFFVNYDIITNLTKVTRSSSIFSLQTKKPKIEYLKKKIKKKKIVTTKASIILSIELKNIFNMVKKTLIGEGKKSSVKINIFQKHGPL